MRRHEIVALIAASCKAWRRRERDPLQYCRRGRGHLRGGTRAAVARLRVSWRARSSTHRSAPARLACQPARPDGELAGARAASGSRSRSRWWRSLSAVDGLAKASIPSARDGFHYFTESLAWSVWRNADSFRFIGADNTFSRRRGCVAWAAALPVHCVLRPAGERRRACWRRIGYLTSRQRSLVFLLSDFHRPLPLAGAVLDSPGGTRCRAGLVGDALEFGLSAAQGLAPCSRTRGVAGSCGGGRPCASAGWLCNRRGARRCSCCQGAAIAAAVRRRRVRRRRRRLPFMMRCPKALVAQLWRHSGGAGSGPAERGLRPCLLADGHCARPARIRLFDR